MSPTATASYSRVTVVNGTRQVDLALPAAVPLSDVMPQLLRFCMPDDSERPARSDGAATKDSERPARSDGAATKDSPQQPVAWTLGRLGGANLSLTQTIGDAAIVDGEVLELRTTTAAVHPAYVEDVRDTIEDAVDESGRRWRSGTTVEFALKLSAFGLAAALVLPEARQPRDPTALGLAVIVAAFGLAGTWWADRSGHQRAAWALAATSALWGGAAGWLASLFAQPPWPVSLASALTAALATAALARATSPGAMAHLAATAAFCAAGLPAGVFALSGLDPLGAVRLTALLTILVIGVVPRISLTVGGMAGADYRVRNVGQVSAEELARRIRYSDVLLHGSLFAVAVVGLVTGLILTASDLWWDRLLGLTAGLGLLLRSRVFSRVPHILPLRLAGLIVLIGQCVRDLREDAAAGTWLVAIAVTAAAVIVAVSAIPLSEVARARLKQVLNWAEIVVVAAMIPLAVGGLGVYSWMTTLIN